MTASSSRTPKLVLVGPAGAGKSTLGRIVAARLGSPFVELDAIAHPYYQELGWSVARLRERAAEVGRWAAEVDWEPARAHAVSRVVTDYPGAVIALGAGHTSYTRDENLAIAREALRQCDHVVRVLPSPHTALSLSVLRERCMASKGHDWIVDGHDFLADWVNDPRSDALATRTVYTNSESPEQTGERLLREV